MCGFVGFFTNNSKVEYDRASVLKNMNQEIYHRGPDSEGFYIDDNVSLGFRRLSIIDLVTGDQPQSSKDGRYTIVYNGEVYNFLDLRKMLSEKHGVEFTTKSDTETILNLYMIYKEKTPEMLRGMFAFVIYDSKTKSLFCARDHFGIKPFYYALTDNGIIFGSEIKAFLHHPDFKKELNKDALKMYLQFQYVPNEETIFKNVYKVLPGTYFTYSKGQISHKRYFDFEFEETKRGFNETVELIDETIQSSVKYHQIADVEIGSFLSGGVDSSYIASLARPKKTYTVGFNIEGFDETNLAKQLCKILKMNNKTKEISPDEFFDALPDIQYYSDEPHANLSAVPLYFLSEAASKDLKVVLSGEGADEFFSGYDSYIEGYASGIYNHLPVSIRGVFGKIFRKFPNHRIRSFFVGNSKSVEDSYIGQAYIMDDKMADKITNSKFNSSMTVSDIVSPIYNEVKDKSTLYKKMYLDYRLWLPHDILLKADKMTMAHSLESRVPLLDLEVWNVARTLSKKERVVGRHTKIALREAAHRHIPSDWSKRKKAGFMVPFREWIKDEKYANIVREKFNTSWAEDLFNVDILIKLLDKHIEGIENNGRIIYTIYSFLIWYEQYFINR